MGSRKRVGTGWGELKHVFSGGDGIIYVVKPIFYISAMGPSPLPHTHMPPIANLMWFRHMGREDGSFTWEGPKTVGTGWGELKQLFSD